MAARVAARYISRRFSSGGKVLSEEEKAAENIYIKKMEQEKLEKAARQGPKAAETEATSSGTPATEAAKASGPEPSAPKISSDKHKNYAVVDGLITALGVVGWYYIASSKKPEEVQD